MTTKSSNKLIILTVAFLLLNITVKGQLTWSVKFINPHQYQVTIVPEDTVRIVVVNISLTTSSGIKTVEKPFTDSKHPTLFPGFTYKKPYDCDEPISKVVGNHLTCKRVHTEPAQPPSTTNKGVQIASGKYALTASLEVQPSMEVKETGTNVLLEADQPDHKTNVILAEIMPLILPYCSNIQPVYKDLEDWLVAKSTNKIQVHVTIINQPSADGSYYYTAWGKSYLKKGTGSDGNCLLTSEPSVNVLYSDRSRTMPDNRNSYGGQPFSIGQQDILEVKLDMAGDVIIARSVTWNFEERFTNVIRNGSIIYGVKKGKMIILNLLKQN